MSRSLAAQAPLSPAPAGILGRLDARGLLEAFGNLLFVLFIFFVCFTFLRPSPYDFIAIPTLALWLCLGIRLHASSLPFVALLLLYNLGLLVALVPYLDEPFPVEWTVQSLYLMVTALFFVMFFSDRTRSRIDLALRAYVASCLFAAGAGIVSYFGGAGGLFFTMDGRAAGVFEDPNVLGSFLILGALTLAHGLLTGRSRHPVLALSGLLILLLGIFLSFSRGSWAATLIAGALMAGLIYRTADSAALRRRLVRLGLAALALGAVGIAALLSVDQIAERFQDRAQVTKDYDEGETGRFGNQRRGLPMLIEKPNGFGPLRWRLTFGLEPHNSYIGGFANGGWLGGFSFLGLVLATGYVGFRLCLRPSPVQRQAQIVWPALFIFFLQAFQIDIDHWRHVFMMFGMVWALEAARLRALSAAPRPA